MPRTSKKTIKEPKVYSWTMLIELRVTENRPRKSRLGPGSADGRV